MKIQYGWLEKGNVETVASKAVVRFTQFFMSEAEKNNKRYFRYWKEIFDIIETFMAKGKEKNCIYIFRMSNSGLKLRISGATLDHCRKRQPLFTAVYRSFLDYLRLLRF